MMKHLIRATMALLLTAGLASAAAIADNDQFEAQFQGGNSFAVPGAAGFIGGAGGGQLGYGFSAATPGDVASEGQTNWQGTMDNEGSASGANFGGTAWTTEQYQESGSFTNGGFAASGQAQGLVGGAAGLTLGGQFGVAGSAGAAVGIGGSAALGASVAANQQNQQFDGFYEQQSVGPNSYVYQTGEQSFGTSNASGAALIGAAGSVAFVGQFGGTVAANNGVATSMEGHGTAVGVAAVGEASVGLAAADAQAYGTQTHSYEQGAAVGNAFQQQTGTVHTEVYAD